jgi:uncharacterized protein
MMIQKLFAAVLFILAGVVCAAAADDPLPHVSVFGTATTQVAPDQMVWHLTVQYKAGKLSSVADQQNKTVQQVLAFLKQTGVKDSEVQMSQMEFGENWEYINNSRVKQGYFASTVVSFRTSELGTYKPLWMGLAEIPGVTVNNVAYDHSKRIEFQNETRQKALLAAKEKAETMAKALGSEIREPLAIEEDLSVSEGWGGSNWNRVVQSNTVADQGATPTADLAPGKIPITIRMKVSFRLFTAGN